MADRNCRPGPARALVGLGSNLGDRLGNIESALSLLRGIPHCEVDRVSRIIETSPCGYADQPDFLNCAASVLTSLSPEALLQGMLAVEKALGRVRLVPGGPRTVDLDLLFHGASVVSTPLLTLPHPRLHERLFVLEPLAEIAPDFMHPLLKKTVIDLLRCLRENSRNSGRASPARS